MYNLQVFLLSSCTGVWLANWLPFDWVKKRKLYLGEFEISYYALFIITCKYLQILSLCTGVWFANRPENSDKSRGTAMQYDHIFCCTWSVSVWHIMLSLGLTCQICKYFYPYVLVYTAYLVRVCAVHDSVSCLDWWVHEYLSVSGVSPFSLLF